MTNLIKKSVCIVLCLIMAVAVVGCGEEKTAAVEPKTLLGKGLVDTGIVAENDKLSLSWIEDEGSIILTDKQTGIQWSNMPEDYLTIPKSERVKRLSGYLQSPIFLEYKDLNEDGEIIIAKAYSDSYSEGNYAAEKTENGITIEYYFEQADIYIPVTFTLNDDHLSVSVDTDKIAEGLNPAYSITLQPFMCAVKEGTADTYMFYPSGSGALIDLSETSSFVDEKYSAEVYGSDSSRKIKEKLTNEKNVYLPVFGIKESDHAMCGIISSGAEQAKIDAVINERVTGYSNITPTFMLRGYDFNSVKGNIVSTETSIYSKDMVRGTVFTVDYYPLYGDDANYNGMAKTYQNYLFGDSNKTVEDSVYSLKFLGGIEIQRNILGFPYKTLSPLTSYTDISDILNELSTEATGTKPNIQLYGFGNSGLDISKVAGGMKLSSKFGSKKQLADIIDFCSKNGFDSYVDFNLSEFKDGGNGFSSIFDAAKTANSQTSYKYFITKDVQTQDTDNYYRYKLLKREKVTEAAEKLLKSINKYGLTGVSFASISDTAYSDYDSAEYSLKSNMGRDVSSIMETYRNSGYKVAAGGANAYAAASADCIFETPLTSSKKDIFTVDVPFYQMVFKGMTEITTENMNSGDEYNTKVLKALETGSSMLFTVYKNYITDVTYSQFKNIYGSVYDSNKANIVDAVKKYGDYYSSISGKKIVNHTLLTDSVRCTTFENGIKIYVNYSDTAYTTPDGVVEANGSLIIK